MTALEKVKTWLATYPEFDILGNFQVDHTDQIPANGGIFPSGLVEIERRKDILGNTTITNQYNFALRCVLEKALGDDIGATINADWIMGFQEWAQEQSATGQAPIFGDVPNAERITAQNGVLYESDEEGTATYMVQLAVQFVRRFPTSNPWIAKATMVKTNQ